MRCQQLFTCAVAAAAIAVPALLPAQGMQSSQSWTSRVSASVRYGVFTPSGTSDVYTLMDRALDNGGASLNPRMTGIDVHARLSERLGVMLGVEAGARTIGSVSRMPPSTSSFYAGEVAQQSTLQLTGVQLLGAEWRALRWRPAGKAADVARITVGGGVGSASYRFRQWGEFLDASRLVRYRNDFYSTGRGTIGFAGATLEVPVRSWIALQGTIRRQFGSAPMSDDYASFNRIDLGGTSIHAGARLTPSSLLRRR